jgi:tetratricopeptide (TPR) repeat protein
MDDKEASIHFQQGFLFLQKQCPNEAAMCFTQALEANPALWQARLNRGNALMMVGRYEVALRDFETVLESERNPLAYMNKGLCLHQLGRSEEGLKFIEIAADIAHDDNLLVIIISAKAEVHNDMGQLGAALNDYHNAIAIKGDVPTLYSYRGQLHYRMEKYAEAVSDISKAVSLSSAFEPDLYYRAHSFWKLKQLNEALQDFNCVIDSEPEEWTNYLSRGRLLDEMGLPDAAMLDMNQAIKLNPECAQAYFHRAFLHALKDDERSRQKSALDFEKAFTIDPSIRTWYQAQLRG